jgi:hypothetical protein
VLGKKSNILYFLLLSFILNSCQNYTKDKYLNDYESFATEIKNDWELYDSNDWLEKENKNNLFYVDYYNQFSSELKPSESIKVQRLNFVFHFYRGDITIKKLIAGEYNALFEGIAIETSDIIHELNLMMNDVEREKNFVIINKLLE